MSTKSSLDSGAPDPSSALARLQKAAKRAKDEGDHAQAAKLAKAVDNLRKYGAPAGQNDADTRTSDR